MRATDKRDWADAFAARFHPPSMAHDLPTSADHWLRHMPGVERQRQELRLVESAWDQLSLLSSLSPLSARAASGDDLAQARRDFSALSDELLQGLVSEALQHRIDDLGTRAQVCIDVLVRNLFERTADIGFFATDVGVAEYLARPEPALRPRIEQRLRAYASKYTVYRDIVLFDAEGRLCASLCEAACPDTDGAAQDLLREAMRSVAPYVERFAPQGFGGRAGPALVYARRVEADGRSLGVLCLVFDLADELPTVFDSLGGANADEGEGVLLALVDAEGRVLGSSDALQLPAGWRLPRADAAGARLLHHLSRRYLAVVRDTHGFQGYAGPGWRGLALLPIDLAFDEPARGDNPSALNEALAGHAEVLSAGLRDIPRRASAIESALERSVWNGLLELRQMDDGGREGALAPRDLLFAQTLLSEIGGAARRTARVFAGALQDLYGMVTRSLLSDAQSRAALAMQILDRNLYERANDCRWWALTPQFASTLRTGETGCARASAVLRDINALYTVYSGLALFDRQGRVVAVSRAEHEPHVGAPLGDAPWVARCLGLADEQHHVVSDFEPNRFSAEPAFVYAAAVRGENGEVLGGVAVVWDAVAQLRSILDDVFSGCGPRDALAFVDARDRVVLSVGASAPLQADGVVGTCRTGGRLVNVAGQVFGVGVSRGQGYREYRARDGHDHGLSCLSLRHLCERRPAPRAAPLPPTDAARDDGPARLRLASFLLGGHWLALDARHVLLAAPDATVLGRSGARAPFCGLVQVGEQVHPVVDLRQVVVGLDASTERESGTDRQLIVVRVPRADGAARSFALRVDALGPMVDVAPSRRQRLGLAQVGGGTPLIDALVAVEAPGAGGGSRVLCCIAPDWLARCADQALGDCTPLDLDALLAHA